MDFIGILQQAQSIQRESRGNAPVKRYSTALPAPKKLPKPTVNTDALKKYFEKKELDERQKLAEKLEQKTKLLELRSQDKKSNRRVQAMLKRTKAASKAVIEGVEEPEEAHDTSTYQPDEDDYGYVSQSAAEMHKKVLSKYNMTNVERTVSKPKNDGNLDAVKKRVNDSLNKEMEEEAVPGKRRRKKKSHESEPEPEPEPRKPEKSSEKPKKDKDKNVIVRPKVTQPTMNFQEILKLAQTKQFEPVKIEPKQPVKEAEYERPMTQKEKEEYLAEKERRLRREGKLPPIPKTEKKLENGTSQTKENGDTSASKNMASKAQLTGKGKSDVTSQKEKATPSKPAKEEKTKETPAKAVQTKPKEVPPKDITPKQFPPKDSAQKQFPPKDLAPKQFPPKDLAPKQFPPKDLMPKQFPPRDLMPKQSAKDLPRKEFPPKDMMRKPVSKDGPGYNRPMKKRREIESDDEYDSEMDDFIDDEPLAEQSAISREIQSIFGSRYRRYEPSDEESDECMEVGFGQVEKEEMRSLRLGIKEDLEDIERELKEKNRKKSMQKRR